MIPGCVSTCDGNDEAFTRDTDAVRNGVLILFVFPTPTLSERILVAILRMFSVLSAKLADYKNRK